MAKTRKRVLALLMTLVMVLGLLPTVAMAEGPQDRSRNSITVQVVDQNWNSVEGASVTLQKRVWYGIGWSWETVARPDNPQSTGFNGTVTFQNVDRYGTYCVAVTKDGASANKEVSIGTYTVQLELSASQGQKAWFFIRKDGTIPYENGNSGYLASAYAPIHPASGNGAGMLVGTISSARNVYVDFTTSDVSSISASALRARFQSVQNNIVSEPTDAQIKALLQEYDPATQDVLWYVVKNHNDGHQGGCPDWHVDGVIYDKDAEYVSLNYEENTNGHDNAVTNMPSAATVKKGSTLPVGNEPTWTGHEFLGWDTKPDGTGTRYQASESITLNENETLYAIWKADTYTVRYDWATGSAQPEGVTLPGVQENLESLQDVTVAALPDSDGIEGWYTNTNATGTTIAAGQRDLSALDTDGDRVVTLYAYCAPEGTLTITKTFSYQDSQKTTAPEGFAARFVVKDSEGNPVDGSPFTYTGSSIVIPDLPYGEYTVEEEITAAGNPGTAYNSTATVSYDDGRTDEGKTDTRITLNSASATMAVTNHYNLNNSPIVQIDKTATASATVGNEIIYTITVKNIGGADATGVVVTDNLPATGLDLDSVELKVNGTVVTEDVASVSSGTITWNVGRLAKVNGTATLTVSGAVVTEEALTIQSGKIVNKASAHHDALSADGTQDPSDSAETRITRSNLRITKAAATTSDSTGATALQNETITYTITVENSGDAAATVTVVDTLPTDYLQDFTATGSPAGTISGDKMTWSNVTIPAQSGDQPGKVELTFTATVKALSDPTKGVSIVNTVAVQGKPELTDSCTTYVAPTDGTLAIYKSLQGSELTRDELLQLNPGITFTVYDAENTPVETFTLKEVLDSEASLALDPGTYTVYENDADVTGYDLVTTVSGNEVGSEGVAVTVSASGTPATVTFKNVYTSKMYQIVFHDEDVATLSLSGREATAFQWWNAGAEAQWANGGYPAADGTLAFLFGNGNKDSVKNTAVVVTEDPGYAFSGKWYTADGKHFFESFADIVNALDTYAERKSMTYQDVNSGKEVTKTVYTLDVYLDWTYDLTYTFNDFGSEHVSMAYAVGEDATALTSVSAFGTASAPVEVCAQENLDDPDDFQTVFFFVKAEDGYQLSGQYWETSSDTALTSVTGIAADLTPIPADPEDALLAKAAEQGYTHYFTYIENGVGADNVFNADVLNRYFKVVATENPTYTITGTKTVTLGGNRAPGSTTFTFNLEGYRIEANALSLEMGGHVGEIKDTATVTINGSGTATFQFDTIEFTEAGDYVFYVTEVDSSNGSVYWNFDDSEFRVGIYVGEDGNGQLTIAPENIHIGKDSNADGEMGADIADVDAIAFTNTYTRRGGGGGNPGGGTNIPDEDPPTTDLPDEDVPQTDLPDEDVPQTDLPDEDVPQTDLPDEDVPMAEAPKTGDNMTAWVLAAGVSGIALVWLAISGKKRREDNAQ